MKNISINTVRVRVAIFCMIFCYLLFILEQCLFNKNCCKCFDNKIVIVIFLYEKKKNEIFAEELEYFTARVIE